MRKILYAITLVATVMGFTSCLGKTVEDEYKDWRKANDEWFTQQSFMLDDDGKLYYEVVTAPWDPNAKVLMHWFNDRALTKENLSPIYSSIVDVKYKGCLYNGTPFDSSFVSTIPRDSVARFALGNSSTGNVIEGWGIALPMMHVGDSCRIIINYQQGYGTYTAGTIKPFSVLQFDVKLDDIYKYE